MGESLRDRAPIREERDRRSYRAGAFRAGQGVYFLWTATWTFEPGWVRVGSVLFGVLNLVICAVEALP